jgi:hypothetical protein
VYTWHSVCVLKQKPSQKTWRPTWEDIKLLAELKARLGVVNETDVLRMALRALAQKEGMAA